MFELKKKSYFMKNNFLLFAMLISIFAINAQNENEATANKNENRNEVKLNVLFPLSGDFEVTYERILNKKSSLGVSFFTVFDNENGDNDTNYMISPYYRRYFGKKYASGFFVEGFTMLSSIDGMKIFDQNENLISQKDDVIDMSLGLGFGSKWITKSGVIFEINVGYGFLLFNADKTNGHHTIVGKFGFHLGYRF